jgi:hypothetical protein
MMGRRGAAAAPDRPSTIAPMIPTATYFNFGHAMVEGCRQIVGSA